MGPERESLVSTWRALTDVGPVGDAGVAARERLPPGRLIVLVKQAAAWQVSAARRRGAKPWTIKSCVKAVLSLMCELTYSLLQDYAVRVVPETLRLRVRGHAANVKCADFVDAQRAIVSGSRCVCVTGCERA